MRKTGNIGHDILKIGLHVQLGGCRSYKRHGMELWERNQESGLSMRFSRGVFGFHSFTHDMEGITGVGDSGRQDDGGGYEIWVNADM